MPSLPLGGAPAHAGWSWAASSSEPPNERGLPCRPVGAWRRNLMKQVQFTQIDCSGVSLRVLVLLFVEDPVEQVLPERVLEGDLRALLCVDVDDVVLVEAPDLIVRRTARR